MSAPANPSSPTVLRAPSTLPSDSSPTIMPPTLTWLEGTWNVTHSTLPMWKKNRNVKITYSRVPDTSPAHIDDVVTYQPIDSQKLKIVHGVDKPFEVPSGDEANKGEDLASFGYNWRGKGWLMIASSKWEILGYGEEAGADDNQWVVTYFAKTLFTPAGVDIYSRKGQLKEDTVQSIKTSLEGLGGDVQKLGNELFVVTSDDARSD